MNQTSTAKTRSNTLDLLHAWTDMDEATKPIEDLFQGGRYVFEVLLVATAEGRAQDMPEARENYDLVGTETARADLEKYITKARQNMPKVLAAWENLSRAIEGCAR